MKQKLVRCLSWAGMGLLFGGACLLTQGCSSTEAITGPPAVATYDYDYYPDWNVYYYPAGSTYYWYDNGTWVSGSRLPPRYVIRTARHEHVHSQSREPWGAEQKPFDGSGKPPDEFGHQP